MDYWPDAYRQEFSLYEKGESLYQRIPLGPQTEPMDDYDFDKFELWLEYISTILDMQRQNGIYDRCTQALFEEN